MKKLFAAIIPALLISFLFVYSSCNETPIESTSVKSTDNVLQDNNLSSLDGAKSITKDETPLSELPSIQDKINKTLNNNSDSVSDNGVWCTFITIDPDTSALVPTGSSLNWNFRVRSSMLYSAVYAVRLVILYIDNVQIGSYSNWTQGQCVYPVGYNNYQNNFNSNLTIGTGTHTVTARLLYTYTIAGVTHFVDMTDNATVTVTAMDLPSIPNVSFWTTGPQSARRPRLTWTASTPNVTNYVIQRRYYPSGSFSDFATVSGSTFEFIDNSITVVTDRYDLVYYNVEYRVRAVNPVGSSGYQAPSYEWYKHGCYSHSLGFKCAIE